MTTLMAWVARVTPVPCRPSAATATCTSRPATANASRCMRVAAKGGSPVPATARRTTT